MRYLFLFACLFVFSFSKAQISVSAGPSMIKSFGIDGVYPGFHVGAEYSQDDETTLFARIGFYPAQKQAVNTIFITAIDGNTVPYLDQLGAREKFNYTVLEFGKRYYFGEGFDSGLGFYGGSNFSAIFNKVRYELDDYDKTKYTASIASSDGSTNTVDENTFGSIFALAFGLNGGVKNSFYFGTLFFDAGLNYSLIELPSNSISAGTQMYSKLFFTFNFGIRKDFY